MYFFRIRGAFTRTEYGYTDTSDPNFGTNVAPTSAEVTKRHISTSAEVPGQFGPKTFRH